MIRMPGQSHRGPLPPLTEEQRTLEQELHSHVQTLAAQIGERNLFHHDRLVMAADYIRTTLVDAGYEVHRQPYEVEGKICENIEAEVRGSRRPDDIIVIGAHYDSVQGSPGANDNASGVAAMLALARAFAKNQPTCTLRFVAFTNEEPPLFQTKYMGSRVYASRSRERGEKISLMLSLETIGYYSDEPGSQHLLFPLNLIYPSTGNFIAFVSNVENGVLVRQLRGIFSATGTISLRRGSLVGLDSRRRLVRPLGFLEGGIPGSDGDRHCPLPLSRLPFACRQARARSVRTDGARRLRPAGCHRRDGECTR